MSLQTWNRSKFNLWILLLFVCQYESNNRSSWVDYKPINQKYNMLKCETNCGNRRILARDLHRHLSPLPLYAFMAWHLGIECIVGSCFNQNSLWISATLLSCLQRCQKPRTVHTLSGKSNWERGEIESKIFQWTAGLILSASNEIFTIRVYSSHTNHFIQAFNWIQLTELYCILNYT